MPKLVVEVSQSILSALAERCHESGRSQRDIVNEIFASAFALEHGTLFQCSTAGALVSGISDGAITVGELKRHGNFGLGTFEQLDGEMVALEGEYYRVAFDGSVEQPPDGALVPFACITTFEPEQRARIGGYASLSDLGRLLDGVRASNNLFTAVRVDGTFERMRTRSICKQPEGTPLREAAAGQAEFDFRSATGSLIGFWSPAFAKNINVSGWHLHFISDDRAAGGHVLDCAGTDARAEWQILDQLHIALPETAQYLAAELSNDPSVDLERAERGACRTEATSQ